MNKYFLYTSPTPAYGSGRLPKTLEIPRANWGGQSGNNIDPGAGDRFLIASGKGGGFECIIPHLFALKEVRPSGAILELERSHMNDVSFDKARTIFNRGFPMGMNQVTQKEYEDVVALMGGALLSEEDLLKHVKKFISARGYYFSDETIANYHICMKTRPFVILAGLSGTGKSKLSQLYAEAIGHTVQNGRYLRLAVRPSWNDDRFLLGYLNSITGEYITEPAVEFVINAEKDRENLYFFCLDEMNLAHVEYYFSQFLSAMEEENAADRRIYLYSDVAQKRLQAQGKPVDVDRIAIVPDNLLFTGTINVDETTQSISDKVIDRANTIEFFDIELSKVPDRQPTPEPIRLSSSTWNNYRVFQPENTSRLKVMEINEILNKSGLGLGYRVLREVELYMANSTGLLNSNTAFDLQVKQRILPRVRGTAAILSTLRELIAYMKSHNLSRSGTRLEEMEGRLKRDGYTSFWR
jgi:hypothetical protein